MQIRHFASAAATRGGQAATAGAAEPHG
jgi:hypothetical protein